ncbi:Predicted O-methyltransferase YrrM [Brevibacterium linens]|uniref:Predicted O-methyltransferase YrrM n=2 Tax=Brevibacteriaceae TaxID=85019 RepID=A0A2H1KF40_BRELN|nr:Predicted O-methyltransferase YrrM [Brevibacterium linens]
MSTRYGRWFSMRKNGPMNEFEPSAPVNRYEASDAWRTVDRYFTSTLVGEDSALVVARDSGDETTMPNAEVAANQGAFLELLAQIAGARRVLEFGTLAGYSTIWLARAVGEQGQVVTLELEPQNAAVAEENFHIAGVSHRIETIVGRATESAERLIHDGAEPFDFVFIDADKPNNPAYLAAALKLTRSGAVIVIDNVVRNGAVADAASADPRVQGVRAVAEDIAAHPDLDGTALQTVGEKGWDGLIIARRR